MRLERANSKKPVTWLSFLGLVLIPIIVGAGFILATWKSSDRLETIDAAIVNNDDGAKIDGETVPIGRQLTSGLVGEEKNNINWVISDTEDAEKGLEDGTYAAVLTIPEGFSRAVTSVSDAEKATQTGIDVDVSKVAPAADAVISQSVTEVARTTFNTEMTKNYLDNIYLGFNETGTQMRDLSDAAGELDKGASGLTEGTKKSADGAGELSKGMDTLSSSGGELNKGAGELAKGASGLSEGTSGLSDGLDQLNSQTKDLPESTEKLADGAGQLSDGVDKYTKGVDKVADGGKGLADGIEKYQQGLEKGSEAAAGAESLAAAEKMELIPAGGADKIRADLCKGSPAEVCAGLEKAYLAGMSGGMQGAAAGLDDKTSGKSLSGGAEELSAGLDDLSKGSAGLRKGASGVAEGNEQLAEGMPELSKGISKLADGSKELDKGAGELSKGMNTFTGGLGQYVTGVQTAATGTGDLAAGLGTLSEGSQKYSEGTKQFADGVEEGAEKVPSYTAPERDTLAKVASANIEAPDTDEVTDLLAGSTIALLIMLALWIGALATYTVLKPIPASTLLSTRSSVSVWLRGLWPGAAVGLVQALVLSVLAISVMDLDAVQTFDIVILTFVSALVFMVLNFALVAWFGGFGRFASVIAVVLAVAGRTIGAVPEFFHAVAPLLPLTPAMDGFAAIAGGTSGLGVAYGGLLAWAIIGLVMSLLAIVRARTTKPEAALAMA